ncbi:MAG: FAD-dependent oxidoreductase [Clostridiales bacterium]|nr:FAD-dependent oxidoreductase [Clostridiales bacterium]
MSIWQGSVRLPVFPPLSGDVTVPVAIIGGGMAGLLTAHCLQERGIDALVLEADTPGAGQTGRTTAKITSQHHLRYADLIDRLGMDAAALYARANEEAIAAYARMIEAGRICCGFTRCDAYLYSSVESGPLLREEEAARSVGIAADFTRQTELPFPIAGALRFREQARFHPLKFLGAIAENLNIRAHSRVMAVEDDCIHTDRGTVRAEHIVFACHYPFINAPGWYFTRMHQERSYVLALKNTWLPRHMYLGVDEDGLSLRAAEGMLLLGGAGHRTGENTGGGRYDLLRDAARTLVPGAQEVACWSAQDCVTVDRLPCIGQYAPSQPRWYVATGFAKWGMTTSMVAARVLSGMIAGDPPDYAEVFSPQRPVLTGENMKPLLNEAGHVLRSLVKATPAPRCTHLGCEMTWNPDEGSWDCPCHGSRFAGDGAVLDGPAQTPVDLTDHQY